MKTRKQSFTFGQAQTGWLPVLRGQRGFTLLELLVVVAIIGILAALLLSTIPRVKQHAQKAQCLNNLKQLQLCWQMYVDDHEGRVPPNLAYNINGAWRSTPDSWIGNSSAPHDADTQPIENGLLFKYDYNRSVQLYHCPADRSEARLVTGKGLGVLRTRSYSMNGNLGGRTSEVQRVVYRESDMPAPARIFVLIDENADSIDDAHFLVWPAPDDRWVNMPADRHAQSGVLSFADGHVEAWKWLGPKDWRKKSSYWKRAENPQDLADLRRLQGVTLAPRPYALQPTP